MADLGNVLVFDRVARFESISRAARSLGMPISTVSRRLSVLESELRVSLLRRTTHRVTLTPEGREYFNKCQEPLTLLQEAEQVLSEAQKRPEGMVRITVPISLAREPFLEFLSRFSKDHPQIRIDLFVTNAFLDLVAENIDLAIRVGDLRDSSLVAIRIGTGVRYVVAAPEYLKGRNPPAEPADLELHDCVMLNAKNNESDWDLVSGKKEIRVHVSGSISTRDHESLGTLVHQGHGVGLLWATYCNHAFADGRLTRLLPKWTSPRVPIYAVYPSRKYLPLRLSVFLDALGRWNPFQIEEYGSGG